MGGAVSDEELCRRLTDRRLTVDGTSFPVDIDPDDCRRVYLPLARHLLERARHVAGRRCMVGIAGPPGAGKSCTATILAAVLEELGCAEGRPEWPLVAPLDGFHYANAYLSTHTASAPDGTAQLMSSLKGMHLTFDGERALAILRRVRAGEDVKLPLYSRELHDPVEDALAVGPQHRLVLVEGNYLYLDVQPWAQMRELFDVKLFLTAPTDVLLAQVIGRHTRGGAPQERARAHAERVDLVNIEMVRRTESYADVVIAGPSGSRKADYRFAAREESAGRRRPTPPARPVAP